MKLTIFFLTVFLLQVSARSVSQEVTLSADNASLEKLMPLIEQQTGYSFFYKVHMLAGSRPVTIEVKNMPLENFLQQLFNDQPLEFTIRKNIIVISQKEVRIPLASLPYFLPVTGVVTDAEDKPLAGATVSVKGKDRRVTSDNQGRFTLAAERGETLIITYVGYETATHIIDAHVSVIHIRLILSSVQMQDVNIMANNGYQKINPNESNGSVVVIDNKTLNQQVGVNILERLNGVTSSLLFNVGKSISDLQSKTGLTVRGLSSIKGSLDPLIVLDNFIYEGDINNINPNDIENITILKDAAAASIWGARAGNGVIVILTKKGKFGQPFKLDFNTTVQIKDKPDLYYLPQMRSADFINMEELMYAQGNYTSAFNSNSYSVIAPAVEIFNDRKLNRITAADSAAKIDALKRLDSRDQYNRYVAKKGVTQQYALNMRGGTQNISWLISGAYDHAFSNQQAVSDKINLRVENTYRPVKDMYINAGVYYTNSTNGSGAPDYKDMIRNGSRPVIYQPFADDHGNPLAMPYYYRPGYIDTAGGGKLLNWKYYPLENWKHVDVKDNIEEIVANLGFQYKLVEGLTVDLKYQYQRQRGLLESKQDTGSFNSRNQVNLFSQINRNTGVVTYVAPIGGIYMLENSAVSSQNFRGQLNLNKTFNEHTVTAIAGMEARQTSANENRNTYYGYNEDPLRYVSLDPINNYPTYITGSMSGFAGSSVISQTYTRFLAYYGNLDYTYRQRYILSGSLRKDGSNIFGASTNDKWKPLWSAGLGWNISKESFYTISWLPFLKLTATLGYSGNVDLSRTALPVGSAGTDRYTLLPSIRINYINNPELKWEQAYQANFRIDFATKRNIFSGSLEYYRKKGTDLYGETPYDYTGGGGFQSTITKNVAAMKGDGVDITLQSQNINRSFKWDTRFLFSYNLSRTTAYYTSNASDVSQLIGNSQYIIPVVGMPMFSMAVYKWGGLDASGDPQGYLNGEKSKNYQAISNNAFQKGLDGGSIVYVGSTSPRFFGSLMNFFTWKHLSASFNITYKLGYSLLKPSYDGTTTDGTYGGYDFDQRWQKPGDENSTNVPALRYPEVSNRGNIYLSSEANVIKGDHLRLNYINLGYHFLRNTKKGPFNNVELFVNLGNLGVLWTAADTDLDPDYIFAIPPSKTYAVGIRTHL